MSNIFNDLNKLVNTVQKVDKLLTEKPKRTRVKTTSVSLSNDELGIIMEWFKESSDTLVNNSNYQKHHNLYNRIKINYLQTKQL
jgi:hypothetical protein